MMMASRGGSSWPTLSFRPRFKIEISEEEGKKEPQELLIVKSSKERKTFVRIIATLSLDERGENGRVWYPLFPRFLRIVSLMGLLLSILHGQSDSFFFCRQKSLLSVRSVTFFLSRFLQRFFLFFCGFCSMELAGKEKSAELRNDPTSWWFLPFPLAKPSLFLSRVITESLQKSNVGVKKKRESCPVCKNFLPGLAKNWEKSSLTMPIRGFLSFNFSPCSF